MSWIALWLLHSRCSLLQLHDLHATCISHEFEVQEGSIVFETIEQCSWPVLRMFLIIWGISKRNIANSESESSKLSPGWFPDIIARVAFFQNWNEWLDCNQLCRLKKKSMDWTVKDMGLETFWAFLSKFHHVVGIFWHSFGPHQVWARLRRYIGSVAYSSHRCGDLQYCSKQLAVSKISDLSSQCAHACRRSLLEPCKTMPENMAKRLICFLFRRRPEVQRDQPGSTYVMSHCGCAVGEVSNMETLWDCCFPGRSWTTWPIPKRRMQNAEFLNGI